MASDGTLLVHNIEKIGIAPEGYYYGVPLDRVLHPTAVTSQATFYHDEQYQDTTVAPGSAVVFEGVMPGGLGGIRPLGAGPSPASLRPTPGVYCLPHVGVYRIAWSVPTSVTSGGNLVIATGLRPEMLTELGTSRATIHAANEQICGRAFVETHAVNTLVSLRNPAAATSAIKLAQSSATLTQPFRSTLSIVQISF